MKVRADSFSPFLALWMVAIDLAALPATSLYVRSFSTIKLRKASANSSLLILSPGSMIMRSLELILGYLGHPVFPALPVHLD